MTADRKQDKDGNEAASPLNPSVSVAVLIADDHPVVREGLRGMLSAEPGVAVVGEAASGDEAVAMARLLRPDVVLMDLRMPGGDGVSRHGGHPGCRARYPDRGADDLRDRRRHRPGG